MIDTLHERQKELHALRTHAAFLIESVNGKFVAWMIEDLAALEAICARLSGEFSDLNGKIFADELLSKLAVRRPVETQDVKGGNNGDSGSSDSAG